MLLRRLLCAARVLRLLQFWQQSPAPTLPPKRSGRSAAKLVMGRPLVAFYGNGLGSPLSDGASETNTLWHVLPLPQQHPPTPADVQWFLQYGDNYWKFDTFKHKWCVLLFASTELPV